MNSERSYCNGSYKVQINVDTGSKYFFGDNLDDPDFPDSIDLKITNHCLIVCPFCYESSGVTGKHADFNVIKKIFKVLPKVPLEVAIGGGDPLDNPDLPKITKYLADRGHIVNMTVSIYDIGRNIPPEISGLGISLGTVGEEGLPYFEKTWKQTVWHSILGITPISVIEELLSRDEKILVLGYKNMGRGQRNSLPDLKVYEQYLKSRIHSGKSGTLSFDELAVQQLKLRETLLQKDWDLYWIGPEFSHSMFVDAVSGTFYPSSTDRKSGVSWTKQNIIDYFKKNHVKNTNRN